MEPLKHIFLGIIIDNNKKRIDFNVESSISDREEILHYMYEFIESLETGSELKFDGKTRMVSSNTKKYEV